MTRCPLETKEGRTTRTKEKAIQRKQVSHPDPSPRTNQIKRDELIEMVIDLMTHYGGAKSWPTTSDIFEGESQTVMHHIRAKGWLWQHIPIWCEEAIMERGQR